MKRKIENPFVVTGFTKRAHFCDREDELEWMHENFGNGRNMVLYAWRRLGKSVLIRCFFHELESKKKADTLYIDLLGTRNMQDAVNEVTRVVYERYGRTKGGIPAALAQLFSKVGVTLSFNDETGMPELNFTSRQLTPHERSLNALGEFLSDRKRDVVIAFDEFQQLTRYKDANAEARLRAWMQEFPNIRMIFSGSHRQMMHSMFADRNRPFYRSSQLHALQPIPLEEYRKFIIRQFKRSKKEIQSEQIDHIYSWARGQTYTIQLVCNKLFARYDKVENSHIEQMFDDIIDQEKPVFANYSNLLTENQWQLMVAIAREEPAVLIQSAEFLRKHNLGAASSAKSALSNLLENELIIQEDDGFYVHDVIFSRWLRRLP